MMILVLADANEKKKGLSYSSGPTRNVWLIKALTVQQARKKQYYFKRIKKENLRKIGSTLSEDWYNLQQWMMIYYIHYLFMLSYMLLVLKLPTPMLLSCLSSIVCK